MPRTDACSISPIAPNSTRVHQRPCQNGDPPYLSIRHKSTSGQSRWRLLGSPGARSPGTIHGCRFMRGNFHGSLAAANRIFRPRAGSDRSLVVVELELVEVAVEDRAFEELVVRAGGHDSTVIHDDDAVGFEDRGEPVRDGNDCAASERRSRAAGSCARIRSRGPRSPHREGGPARFSRRARATGKPPPPPAER